MSLGLPPPGRLNGARQWAVQHDVVQADPANYLSEYELLTYARLIVAERQAGRSRRAHDLADVQALLGQIADAADSAGRRGSVIEARMMQALAIQVSDDRDGAHETLAPALEKTLAPVLAEGTAAGYLRLFLDEGAPMRDLLHACVTRLGVRRVTANSFLANQSSWRLMERVGMRREQHVGEAYIVRGGGSTR